MTHQQVAEAVGRSRAAVSNLMRLLELDERVAEMLAQGKIEMGHARALLSLDKDKQHVMAMRVYAEQLTVRATEALVRQSDSADNGTGSATGAGASDKAPRNAHIVALENQLSDQLGARVNISHKSTGSGQVIVSYNSLDELDGILAHIK